MGWNQQIRNLKHRFENRRPSLSRLVLGTKIKNPLEHFDKPIYELASGIPIIKQTDSVTTTSTESAKVEEGAAFDSIVVEASDGSLHHAGDSGEESWSFSVAFAKWNSLRLGKSQDLEEEDDNHDNDDDEPQVPPTESIAMAMKVQNMNDSEDSWFSVHNVEETIEKINGDMAPWPWEELRPLLREGANHVVFFCHRRQHGDDETPVLHFARASIWLWKVCDKVIISDIDGTLTKSNARGVLGTIITQNYDMVTHSGVCDLLSKLAHSQMPLHTKALPESAPALPLSRTRVVYLTSRPIHLANKTREFLSGLVQTVEDNATGLPVGPLLGFGGNLAKVLSMEVLSKTSQAFKAGELETRIVRPFRRARECGFQEGEMTTQASKDCEIFVAAFGNNLNDVQAYHKTGMDLKKIFLIDKNSKIVTFDKETIDDTEPPRGEEGFPPHSWYKDRISTVFENGYFDEKLRAYLKVIDE